MKKEEAGNDNSQDPNKEEASSSILGESESNIAEHPNAINSNSSSIIDASKVSTNHLFIILAVILLGAIIIMYYLHTKSKKQPEKGLPFASEKPIKAQDIPMPRISGSSRPDSMDAFVAPPAPPPQALTIPTAPKPAAQPEPQTLKLPDGPKDSTAPPPKDDLLTKEANAKAARQDAKDKSSIMLTNSGGGVQSSSASSVGGTTLISVNTASGNFVPSYTSASGVKVTMVGDMSIIITQGKILDAVLETPINTSNVGPIRALISKDVYSERGTNVLIPKGSRIVGTLKGGYTLAALESWLIGIE